MVDQRVLVTGAMRRVAAQLLPALLERGAPRLMDRAEARPADLQQLVIGALDADVKFGVYRAVSWPSRHRWDIGTAVRDLGYAPQRSDDHPPESAEDALTTCRRP